MSDVRPVAPNNENLAAGDMDPPMGDPRPPGEEKALWPMKVVRVALRAAMALPMDFITEALAPRATVAGKPAGAKMRIYIYIYRLFMGRK